MVKKDSVTEQRDRFLAFSFAASDLFMEIGSEDRIEFAFGAVKGLTGIDAASLHGRVWTDIFVEEDRFLLKIMLNNATVGKRCGPVLITLQSNDRKEEKKALISAIKMPGKKSTYLTFAFPNTFMMGLGEKQREEMSVILDKETFSDVAQKALKTAVDSGKSVDMTMLDLDLDEIKERIPEERWDLMMGSLSTLLKSSSLEGEMVAQISENKFGLLHDKSVGATEIQDQVADLLKDVDPEGADVEIDSASIEAKPDLMNEREVTRALMYTLSAFEKDGADLTVQTLEGGFKDFLSANEQKIQDFKAMVANVDFRLFFQPIIQLSDFTISHYEMLTRFEDGGSPYEMITFGEDVGLAADFDLAVCKRAIGYIERGLKGPGDRFAVNISGQSINNEQFFQRLHEILNENQHLSNRLMFEITESVNIDDLEKVNRFIKVLRDSHFQVALDDFGTGSSSFEYLQKLDVDYVKLDGQYTQNILDNKKSKTMVRNLAQLCKELDVEMIAERIETVEEVRVIKQMDIAYGQGYWFSKPAPKPEYKTYKHKQKEMLDGLPSQ